MKRLSAILLTSLLLFLVCSVAFVNNVHATTGTLVVDKHSEIKITTTISLEDVEGMVAVVHTYPGANSGDGKYFRNYDFDGNMVHEKTINYRLYAMPSRSHDGRFVSASSQHDHNRIYIYVADINNVTNGTEYVTYDVSYKCDRSTHEATWSYDDKYIAVGTKEGVFIFNTETETFERKIPATKSYACSFHDFGEDYCLAYFNDSDNKIHIVEGDSGVEKFSFDAQSDAIVEGSGVHKEVIYWCNEYLIFLGTNVTLFKIDLASNSATLIYKFSANCRTVGISPDEQFYMYSDGTSAYIKKISTNETVLVLSENTDNCHRQVAWFSLDNKYITYRGYLYHTDLPSNYGGTGEGGIPDFSDKWLHFGDVDVSAFYFVKNYKYCEAKRNIPMSIIVKRIEIAFDPENQNFTGTNNLDLYFSGIHLGHPDSITRYSSVYNDIYLAEWTDLNLYLNNTYPVIELKCTWQKNGYYYNGIGVFNRDVDNDGQKNMYFHNIDSVYGNGQAEGSTNILYDLAYRVWYVLQGYEVNDSIVCQKDTVQYYDTIAISYSADIEETTYLIIYNASDDEVLNITLSNVQGKIFFTPTEDMGTGMYTASLVRGGTKVANDTFSVVEGNTQYAVWVDKNSVLPNEQFTIYYKLPEGEYGQIEILRGNTVVYSVDVEGSTNIQTLAYSNDNAGMYTIKLYRNVNGTLYLKDDEIVTIGEGYYINTINVDKTKLSEGDTVKIYGTHQYAGYDVYVLIQPGGLVYDVSNSNSFEIDFKATQSADYVAYLMLDNQILDSVSFTVAPAGTYEKNPLVENFNYILAVAIIVIFAILGVAISNKAHITASHKWFVTAIFVLIGLFICIVYNLIPLWIPFLVALVLVAYIIKEVL